MKLKKTKILISIVLLIVLIVFLFNRTNTGSPINRLVVRVFDKNKVIVNTIDNIKTNDVIIKCYNSSEESNIIYKDGMKNGRIKNVYGGDNFEVYIKDSLIARCGISKTNWWYTHTYIFNINKVKKDVFVDFVVRGPCKDNGYYNNKE